MSANLTSRQDRPEVAVIGPARRYAGPLCRRRHDDGTGRSTRYVSDRHCVACTLERRAAELERDRKPRVVKVDQARAEAMRARGMTLKAIAAEFRVTLQAIAWRLRRREPREIGAR
jgi:hypothetical protein